MSSVRNSRYFNYFIQDIGKVLSNGVGITMTFYGFDNGSVIKVELKPNTAHHMEEKKSVHDLKDALLKTSLLDKDNAEYFSGKSVTDTIVTIVSVSCFLLLKPLDETYWNEDASHQDFLCIVSEIVKKYGSK
ncbi:MAG: hypothetical protein U0K81_08085 [Paludibacteraceae bacterium]|nr:hypothetical protein [Paludibacteraceae bacterium]